MKLVSLAFLAALSGVAFAQPGTSAPAAPPAPAPSPTVPTPGDPEPGRPTNAAGAEVLTLDRAIEIAMKQQPSLRQTQAELEASRGRIDQARVALRPVITLDASIGSSSSETFVVAAGTAAGATRQPEFFSHAEAGGLGATASWRLYDFGLTAATIRAAELNATATAATIGTTTLDIRNQVELAFLEAVARRRLVLVAESTVRSEDAHLDQAKRFVAAQAKDPIEVAQAQSRDANAKSALAQAQSNEAISLANLRSAIGWLDPAHSPTVSPDWPAPSEQDPPALTALVETARKLRPEIAQLDRQIEAADASWTAARAERRPVLSAHAETQWSPETGNTSPQPTWSAGLQLSWNLFDGGKSSADARVARANLASAAAQRDALLVLLTSQLDSARAQIVANRANVQASTEAVTATRAQLQLAEARYAQGLGSQIELADAQTDVTTAQGNLVTAEFQLGTAWAQLHRAAADEVQKPR